MGIIKGTIQKDKFRNLIDEAETELETSIGTYIGSASDGGVINGNANWTTCRTASAGNAVVSDGTSSYLTCDHDTVNYRIRRVFLYFDTSSLPGNTVITATSLFFKNVGGYDAMTMHCVDGSQTDPLGLNDFDAFTNTSRGSVAVTTTSQWNEIVLDANGIAHINLSGTTLFVLIDNNDLTNTTPTSDLLKRQAIYMTESTGNEPYLSITSGVLYPYKKIKIKEVLDL